MIYLLLVVYINKLIHFFTDFQFGWVQIFIILWIFSFLMSHFIPNFISLDPSFSYFWLIWLRIVNLVLFFKKLILPFLLSLSFVFLLQSWTWESQGLCIYIFYSCLFWTFLFVYFIIFCSVSFFLSYIIIFLLKSVCFLIRDRVG